MSRGIYLAGAAMVSRQLKQDALANNIANVSTPGFKAGRIFSEVLGEIKNGIGSVQAAARGQNVYIDFSQGQIEHTGRSLDFAIEGDGFFVLRTPDGERYTRSGSFNLDSEGRLIGSSGYPVKSDGGRLILDGADVVVKEDGSVFVDERPVGKILVKQFADTDLLEREGSMLFGPRAGARLREVEVTGKVRQKSLEASNVTGMEESIRMMNMLRQYESCSRAIQIQNAALGRTVNELIQP